MEGKTIIISRTDGIGDVVLTLPMAGVLKSLNPAIKVVFLGRKYTKDIISTSVYVDEFMDWDEIKNLDSEKKVLAFKKINADAIIHVLPNKEIAKIAKKAKIKTRTGTTNRIFHWLTCNDLVRLSRKNSDLHEAQLNLKLLVNFGAKKTYILKDIHRFYGMNKIEILNPETKKLISNDKFNIIIHPLSHGSGREWGLDNFSKFINILPEDKFKIFVTGTENEGVALRDKLIKPYPQVIDMTGKLPINQLIAFINQCDGLVASGTGPLHLAAALGKVVVGLFPPLRPVFPTRWAPLGEKSTFLVRDIQCSDCKKNEDCECMRSISPESVLDKLLKSMQ